MSLWTGKAPANPEKAEYLHDRSERPDPPSSRPIDLVKNYAALALGLIFTAGLVALAFQTRGSWESHRDWVVPVTIPFWAIAGVALGYLVNRRQVVALGPGLLFLVLAIAMVLLNIWRGSETEGSDGLRDALSILAGVFAGLAVVSLMGALFWVEAKDPTRPPQPEA